MPKLRGNADEIKGLPPLPEGMYFVRCDGFKPRQNKDKDSVNLNPVLKVTNHPEHNDRVIFDNLSAKAKWIWKDFAHCFGVTLPTDANGDFEFPGNFDGPDDFASCENWQYSGPLMGQIGQVYVIQSSYNGNMNNKIKSYVCKVPGCAEKHSTNLAK